MSDRVLAIDPGPTHSAMVTLDDGGIRCAKTHDNEQMRCLLTQLGRPFGGRKPHLVVEMVASYGRPVGAEVFETCVWIGRFLECWQTAGGTWSLLYRKDVKLHVCNNGRAKDSHIRQALIDRFGAPGTKKRPGLTYGLKKDEWQALAVAVTYVDSRKEAS